MGLLPTTGDDLDLVRFQIATQPGYTHKLDIDQQRVRGTTDERDAVLQAVYLILNVERYAYPVRPDRQAQGLRHERDEAPDHRGAAPGRQNYQPQRLGV